MTSQTSVRILANRAEIYAMQLRGLARSVKAARREAASPITLSILEADMSETVNAATRLRGWLGSAPVEDAILVSQVASIEHTPPAILLEWAARWEAYALEIDP